METLLYWPKMAEPCTCSLRNSMLEWRIVEVMVTLGWFSHTSESFFLNNAFQHLFFPPLSAFIPSSFCSAGKQQEGTRNRLAVARADIIFTYSPQDVKRETAKSPIFVSLGILRKKLGDFTWKQLFNFVRDHEMSTSDFLNAIWLWGDVSIHVFMLKALSPRSFYSAVVWSRDI